MQNRFKDILRELRNEHGLGQNSLASDLNLSNAIVSYWENGKNEPTLSSLIELAQYFDVSIDYLCGLNDEANHAPELNNLKNNFSKLSKDNRQLVFDFINILLTRQENK